MKRLFLFPIAALTALSGAAFAKPAPSTVVLPQEDEIGKAQLDDAVTKASGVYRQGEDAFAFTLDQAGDGTLIAQHRSHMSHMSHSSHSSHYSSRY